MTFCYQLEASNTPFTLHFRTVPGQRTVLAWIGCEQCKHMYPFTLLLRNYTSTAVTVNFKQVCHTHTPSYYNLTWLWQADICCSPLQSLVGKSAYDATRVLFHTGDASFSDQYAIAVVHIVEFVYLTIFVHKCINDVT